MTTQRVISTEEHALLVAKAALYDQLMLAVQPFLTLPATTLQAQAVEAAGRASDAFAGMFASVPPLPTLLRTTPKHPYDRNFES